LNRERAASIESRESKKKSMNIIYPSEGGATWKGRESEKGPVKKEGILRKKLLYGKGETAATEFSPEPLGEYRWGPTQQSHP